MYVYGDLNCPIYALQLINQPIKPGLKQTMKRSYLKITILFIFLVTSSFSNAQYITTIIGNGISACYLSDAGPLCIPLSYPRSVCVAPNELCLISNIFTIIFIINTVAGCNRKRLFYQFVSHCYQCQSLIFAVCY